MQVLADVFDAISADLFRELQATTRRPAPSAAGPVRQPFTVPLQLVAPIGVTCSSLDSADSLAAPPAAASRAHVLAGLRERYLAAADATAAFSEVYVMPAICLLVYGVAINVLRLSHLSACGLEHTVWSVSSSVTTAVFATLLCAHGQRLEEAAARPAVLLLRQPPSGPQSAVEAAHLLTLADGLRPAAAAGCIRVNGSLLCSMTVSFVTYLVVLLQMR
ncbi:hypothetical protein FJT64_006568 [Amphibalanus amphitrite]|uniref:Gustatory receptor n=1 Tax=Amphibalanus amphitrite TaxID=1232801 RepID=A0A6A4VQM6_AMPAM|nr:hypothetical protein FJT64_006568 [Amphibalanus amphitrite]